MSVRKECESTCEAIEALLENINDLEQENARLRALLLRKNAGEDISQDVINSDLLTEEAKDFLYTATIRDLGLSSRVYNALERHCWSSKENKLKRNMDGLITVKSLVEYKISELFAIRMLGQKGLTELYEALKSHGLSLMKEDSYDEEVRFRKYVGEK